MDPTSLSHDEGLQLLRALVHRIAEDEGLRMLSIKGPVTEMHGLRPPRRYSDVDVLVEPAGIDAVVARLVQLGWVVQEAPPSRDPLLAEPHSVTLQHPRWPVELDVHFRYPGMLGEPHAVFDALWGERSVVRVAGVDVPAAGLAGSILISHLHAARENKGIDHTAESAAVAARAAELADPETLVAVARATGATESAAAVLALAGVEVDGAFADAESLRRWQLSLRQSEVRGLSWSHALRTTAFWRWPVLLLRALLSDEAGLRRNWPEAPPGRRGLWLARWWRLRRGLPDLPRAISLAWRPRRR